MGFNLAILISGRGSNMLNIVDACNNKTLSSKVKIIISNNKKSSGLAKVKKKGIKTKIIHENQIKKFEKKLSQILLEEKINLICLAGFMRILSEDFLCSWKKKVINIHPSILPAFSGLDAVKQAIEKKVKYTGCTIHYVDKGIDTGEIIDQRIVRVLNTDNEKKLAKKILKEEHILYIKVIETLEKEINNGKIK
ncbi:MAG: phosphoribosylglycinamide formyltransferase [Rickettsiales bacterium]|nr:phosphoribosylglycinamide formyltransferase [Rickettsiales bacterium]RPG14453.1 MAG: phosphoribosylglycinamide formyltransferase [Pelagibacteraceae bacterium TMED195]|tara:strand:+ start:20 stop:601 length:582 start_codon:yes stop_codon:yes gene_type:complete